MLAKAYNCSERPMALEPAETLSASLEDYLQAIFWTVAAKGAARAKDIARQLEVKASSVTGALQVLAEKKFVHYRPYQAITLTPEGFDEAARVARRHFIVREFFAGVLGLDGAASEHGARRLEHSLGDDVTGRLAILIDLVKTHREVSTAVAQRFAEHDLVADATSLWEGPATVADLRPGRKAVIIAIHSKGELARRLVDMGLGRGALVEVEGVATGGDPIRVKIRGYRLALRRSEAAAISVVGK